MALRVLVILGLSAIATRAGKQCPPAKDEQPTRLTQLTQLVQISQGSLLGSTSSTADGTRYYQFLGIPYAKPPLGKLRFRAPEDPEPWSGVRNATVHGPTCQVGTEGGSENCLFINVFTPQLATTGSNSCLLPVMVYIHGGAFVEGSGNISPGHLMDYRVVVASINYRLNVFGFLSINGTDAPGNAGLKDQSAALRWVQKNIAQFGGDPGSVTIFGESAGGASVHYNILSPMSKGLFHRAISESGSALNPWAFVRNSEARARRLGELLGHATSSAQELLQALREAPADQLSGALGQVLTAEENERLLAFPFVPSLEFPRSGETPFLPHEPLYMEQRGLFNKVPYITGVTANESLIFVQQRFEMQASYWQQINNDLEQVVPVDLGLTKGSDESLEVSRKVKEFYFGGESISEATMSRWVALQTDLLFVTGVVQTSHAHARLSTSATYNYQFVYGIAYHTMELASVLYGGQVHGQSSEDARLARLLGGLWTSFSRTGVPSVEGEVAWQAVSKGSFPYLQVSTTLALKRDLEKRRMDFWFDIYHNYSNYTAS
ncbi:esterase FE4-like [Bacillus rossius redtenbacheri]|uniref:esterase FE4-like n=1 Tax=Bacillus rossius redtenbacheri TaxID=93214 RepID=UPI002FDD94C9